MEPAGLKAIGRMGLRNQYVLAACGINILLMFYVAGGLSTDSRAGATLLIAASAFYVVAGPAMFIGPLLPFRREHAGEQATGATDRRTQIERGIRACHMSLLPQEGVTQTAVDSLKRLQEVQQIVNRIPVWPFDTITLRRFLVAYVLPLLPVIMCAVTGEAGSICKPESWVTDAGGIGNDRRGGVRSTTLTGGGKTALVFGGGGARGAYALGVAEYPMCPREA